MIGLADMLERSTLIEGDALEELCKMESSSVDIFAMDPPFSSGGRNFAEVRSSGLYSAEKQFGRWIANDGLSSRGFEYLMRAVLRECLRVCKPDGHLLAFIDWRQLPTLAPIVESAGWRLRNVLVWDKMSAAMGNGYRQQAEFVIHASKGVGDNFEHRRAGTVFRHKRVSASTKVHPTEKPVDLLTDMLSSLPGEIVCDPFAGSGATLIAAEKLGKRGIGIDVDSSWWGSVR